MALPRIPYFTYSTSGVFAPSLPALPWTVVDETVGGRRIAASGLPASYLVRRDGLIQTTQRILESEYPSLLDLVTFGQSAQAFTWFPDAADPLTSFQVYLETPAPGERWSPSRSTFQRVLEMALTLRSVDGSSLWAAYFLT